MEATVSKQECEEKHSVVLEIVERLDKIICGTYDKNGQHIRGLIDVVNGNTEALRKLSSVKNYIINGICIVLSGVITGTIVFYLTQQV